MTTQLERYIQMKFEIYTDGSSYINGEERKSSSGYVIYAHERLISSSGKYFSVGTNGKGEVGAVLLALDDLETRLNKLEDKQLEKLSPIEILIISDSLITITGLQTWIYQWIKNSKNGVLRTASNDAVKNGEIFKDIYTRFIKNKSYNISFRHVNSHIIDSSMYTKLEKTIRNYFIKRQLGKEVDELPDAIFERKEFKDARKSYKKKNGEDISPIELLRLLMHNKEADVVASKYLSDGIKQEKGE